MLDSTDLDNPQWKQNQLMKSRKRNSIFRVPAMWSKWDSMERTHHSAFMTSGYQVKPLFISNRLMKSESKLYIQLICEWNYVYLPLWGLCDSVLFVCKSSLWNTKPRLNNMTEHLKQQSSDFACHCLMIGKAYKENSIRITPKGDWLVYQHSIFLKANFLAF